MTTAAQGGIAAAAELEGDDGFTPEERAQFAEMQQVAPPQQGNAEQTEPAQQTQAEQPQQTAQVAQADDDDDDEPAPQQAQGEQKPPRRVGWNKYQREMERANKAETEAKQLREMFSRTDERLKLLNEALTAGQQREEKANEQEDPEPDPEKDIFGWVNWSRRKTQRLEQMISEQRQTTTQQNDERQLADSYVDDARTFASKEPNFGPAYQFLMANRTYELAEYYFGKDLSDPETKLTPEEQGRIKAEIAAEERELVSAAFKNKQSPAERVFKLAKARGFRPQQQQQQPAQQQQGGQKPNGAAAPGSLSEQPSVKEEIGRIQKGVQSATSLSQGGGSPGSQALTPERLANMPEEEFFALMDSLTPAQQRAAMGG